jgi:hypothetical protein
MTNPLRETLDDLVVDVPRHVVPADASAAAWRAGRRRRIGKRVAGSVAALAIAALAVTTLPVLDELRSAPPADSDPAPGVTSYPERIGHQWWVRELPDRPGPVAGVINLYRENQRPYVPRGWHAVSPRGVLWKIPGDAYHEPTISPDGRHLGYLRAADSPYYLHDLVTGELLEFEDISGNWTENEDAFAYLIYDQSPSFWSPDGSRVLLPGNRWDDGDISHRPLLSTDGSLTEVVHDYEAVGHAAGWVSDSELAWARPIRVDPDDQDSAITGITVSITDLTGTVLRAVDLDVDDGGDDQMSSRFSQWSAATSPDGSQLLLRVETDWDDHYLFVYSLDNARVTATATPADLATVCPAGWTSDGRPTIPIHDWDDDLASTAVLDDGDVRPVVRVEPGLGSRCIIWAGDALAGKARGGIFGMANAWPAWWWKEITLLVALSAGAALLIRRRRGVRQVLS